MAFAFSTWFGLGLVPIIPTLVAVFSILPVYWACSRKPSILWPFTLGLTFVGWWASDQSGRFTGIADDGRIVVDEVAGAALLLAFLRSRDHSWITLLLVGYLVVDGIKPWPMSAMESLPGAYGVMGDDLIIAVLVGAFLVPVRVWQDRRK
jgi:phosphatidylglycerophosphatase A